MDDKNPRGSAPARRRLGRGLGSLIAVPVEVPAQPGTMDPDRRGHETLPAQDASSSAPEVIAQPRESASPGPSRSSLVTEVEPSSRDTESGPGQPDTAGDGGSSDVLRSLPLDQIRANPRQPRQRFDDAALEGLATSIKTAGLMQPIIVRELAGTSPPRFEVVAGERRLRAAERIGLSRIPAIVREVDDRTAAEWALIENLQREDLNPMERARAFQRLVEEFGLSHQELAEQMGLDRSTVSNLLRLNDLDAGTARCVEEGLLSLGHAKALLGCTDTVRRGAVAAEAIRQGWSVRQTEARIRAADPVRSGRSKATRKGSAHLDDLQRRIGDHLGTRVRIEPGRNRVSGRLVIEYFTLEQFEGLLERMGFEGGDGRPE